MRVITWKIYRAFPELDRFPDEQCRRFITAAKGSIPRRLLRAVASWFLALLPPALTEMFLRPWGFSLPLSRGAWPLPLGTALAIPLLLAAPALFYVARDRFLRRRVRDVLRNRGECVSCRQSLIGIPLASHNSVTCPECGFLNEVDASLSVLAHPENGKRLFVPVPDTSLPARILTPERSRRAKRAALKASWVLMLLTICSLGAYETFLHLQADRAESECPTTLSLQRIVEEAQPVPDSLGAPNAHLLLQTAIELMRATEARSREASPELWNIDPSATLDFRNVGQTTSQMICISEHLARQMEADELCRHLIREYAAAGLYDQLDAVALARRSIGTSSIAPTVAGMQENTAVNRLGEMNIGRMVLAGEGNDPHEFARAFEANLAIARALRLKPGSNHAFDALSLEMSTLSRAINRVGGHPSTAWLDRIAAAINRQNRPTDVSLAFEGDRLRTLADIAQLFSVPSKVRFGVLSPTARRWTGAPFDMSLSVGTYEQNKAELNRIIDATVAAARKPPCERPALTAPGASSLFLPYRSARFHPATMLRFQDEAEILRRGLLVMIALERCRLATGAYPASLDSLVPTYIASLPVDPWSGANFGYIAADPATDRAGRAYYLYSIAADRTDNKSDSPAGPGRRHTPCLTDTNPITTGDYTINDVD